MATLTECPGAAVRPRHKRVAPLRSYLFLLAPRLGFRADPPVVHYVVEESPERAIEVCAQSYPDHRIVVLRDVTDRATAA
jgi:hypothetical protein